MNTQQLINNLYKRLLMENTNQELRLILSDLYTEIGEDYYAECLRWMVKKDKYPYGYTRYVPGFTNFNNPILYVSDTNKQLEKYSSEYIHYTIPNILWNELKKDSEEKNKWDTEYWKHDNDIEIQLYKVWKKLRIEGHEIF